ncbi:hypothetical protein QQ045_011679 [Rhodiola kirilowii]
MTSHHDIKKDDIFLSTLEMFITQKWHVKTTVLKDNYYSKEFTALVDSGADLKVVQEGLIPTRYFHKTTHTLSHAGGMIPNGKGSPPNKGGGSSTSSNRGGKGRGKKPEI